MVSLVQSTVVSSVAVRGSDCIVLHAIPLIIQPGALQLTLVYVKFTGTWKNFKKKRKGRECKSSVFIGCEIALKSCARYENNALDL